MTRKFYVIDLIERYNDRYLGQALYCAERKECPFYTFNTRTHSGEVLEAFVEGARQVDGEVNLYHVNMPIMIESHNTPHNEIRNIIVSEMKTRIVRTEIESENLNDVDENQG